MRILWITNTVFPEPSIELGLSAPVSGGWMYGLAGHLVASGEIKLAVATLYQGNEFKTLDLNGVCYYLLPSRGTSDYQKHLEPLWQKICAEFLPDIVHIHGTEYVHGLACMHVCADLKYVISIQGLVSICAKYCLAGISSKDVLKNITFRDILRNETFFHHKFNFEKKGEIEKEYIQRTEHVIGRTRWDYAHTKSINGLVNYHFSNETLRDRFYSSAKWDIKNKTDFTIFLSQASYPIKGLHQALKAVALLVKDFPSIKVRVAGSSIINTPDFMGKIKLTGYGAYIRKLIHRLGLYAHVEFTGILTEERMIEEYLNAHLFICPSSIENSPNSLGEAQLLGVPCIASYVGGVPDMVEHGVTGLLYRFEEIEMLAENIRLIFTDSSVAINISRESIIVATKRHSQAENLKQMIMIYRSLWK